MSYRIIGDSCTDLPEILKHDEHIRLAALTIQIEEETIVDDATFNQSEFLRKMQASKECPKSSCPSPESYMQLFEGAEDIYVVTLSSKLSGSYNSAELAKTLYLEEHPNKKIAIFDSKSASVGQALVVAKIKELVEAGKTFEEVVEQVTQFRDHMKTMFVLENLDNLRKNGRLSNLTAVICSALNIKPIMGSDDGEIIKVDQARGIEKALTKMVKYIKEDVKDAKDRILGIAHCNNYERAVFVKEQLMSKVPFKECFITDTNGISTLYANDGGIIVCY